MGRGRVSVSASSRPSCEPLAILCAHPISLVPCAWKTTCPLSGLAVMCVRFWRNLQNDLLAASSRPPPLLGNPSRPGARPKTTHRRGQAKCLLGIDFANGAHLRLTIRTLSPREPTVTSPAQNLVAGGVTLSEPALDEHGEAVNPADNDHVKPRALRKMDRSVFGAIVGHPKNCQSDRESQQQRDSDEDGPDRRRRPKMAPPM
jgi:hypothetical protein